MDEVEKQSRRLRPVGPLRELLSAEDRYATMNEGFFDTPECLRAPRCLSGWPSVTPLLGEWPGRGEEQHFVFAFHAGRALTAKETAGKQVSRSSLVTFAVTVAPKSPELPSYCADSTFSVRT